MIRAHVFALAGLLTGAALLSGCSTLPQAVSPTPSGSSAATTTTAPTPRTGDRDAALGRRAYEEGDYKSATRHFQNALAARLPSRERAIVHKYLAFVYCSESQFEACRAQFRSAFEINPQFDLTQTESGHPLWGPIYREIAADIAKRQPKK
jgi:Tfp pilus assembly protein PilF